jgi:TIR domain
VSNIFVSYRREDSAPYAGRICDRLEAAFGADHVFVDVEDIAPGTDFADAIEKTVGSCDVLLAVIGPRWVEEFRDRAGQQDFVEHEIAAALKRGITVIPVLVGGAAVPAQAELPETLKGLARRQAIPIRDAGFNQDASELVQAIRRVVSGGRSVRKLLWSVVAAGIIIALAGTAYFFSAARERNSIDGEWLARMQRPGQRPYSIRLQLQVAGRTLTGQVMYPTGSGRIEGGTFQKGQLAFYTKHIPQFETEPVTILFSGERRGREIELTATTPDGTVTKGVARKIK